MFGISEIAILLIMIVVIFGAKKLPGLARSMGKSARILKSEARAMKSDAPVPADAAAPHADPSNPRTIQGTVTPSPHTDPGTTRH